MTGIYARALSKVIQSPGKFIVFIVLTVATIYMLYGQHAPGSRFFIEEEPMEMKEN